MGLLLWGAMKLWNKFRFLSEEKYNYKKPSGKCKAEGSIYSNQPGLMGSVWSDRQEKKCRSKSSEMKGLQQLCPVWDTELDDGSETHL